MKTQIIVIVATLIGVQVGAFGPLGGVTLIAAGLALLLASGGELRYRVRYALRMRRLRRRRDAGVPCVVFVR